MREITFLKKNKPKWESFEAVLANPQEADPDTLADQFIELTDDLSYAKTFYPRSKTTSYLNALAAKVHQRIYRNKKEETGRILRFWQLELPLILGASRRELLYAMLMFLFACGIGVFSASQDKSFVRLILGDAYVNQTIRNIENGDPMGVYKQMGELGMFAYIAQNNLRVSILIFIAGFAGGILTFYLLFKNGVMLGSFQYFFFQHDVGLESMQTIYIHGALELSAIVISGCASLVVARSILFPGTYSRVESLKRGAVKGLKIAIGLVPIYIFAAFLEGFVTRYTSMPQEAAFAIIGASLIFIVWYTCIFPLQLAKKGFSNV